MSFAADSWEALGSRAEVVVTDAGALAAVCEAVAAEVAAIDDACSRFRADAELARVHAAGGRQVRISPVLCDAVAAALEAARDSDGLVDPTVGAGMLAAGYDRDFVLLPADRPPVAAVPAAGWRAVRLDRDARTLRVPPGVRLDLGATAKAMAADRAAAAGAAAAPSCGVLVSLGGDIAVAGPAPAGGWPVGLADGHRDATASATVALRAGGLATSSTTQRRWRARRAGAAPRARPAHRRARARDLADRHGGGPQLRGRQHGQHSRARAGRARAGLAGAPRSARAPRAA